MASARQIAANRANATKARGPCTVAGKLIASCNAQRHGLSVPLGRDSDVRNRIERLAIELVGGGASHSRMTWARAVAEGQLEIDRVRGVRNSYLADVGNHTHPLNPEALRDLAAFDRYEQRARGMRNRAAAKLQI